MLMMAMLLSVPQALNSHARCHTVTLAIASYTSGRHCFGRPVSYDVSIVLSIQFRRNSFLAYYGIWPTARTFQPWPTIHRLVLVYTGSLRINASPSLHKIFWPLLWLWLNVTKSPMAHCTLPECLLTFDPSVCRTQR